MSKLLTTVFVLIFLSNAFAQKSDNQTFNELKSNMLALGLSFEYLGDPSLLLPTMPVAGDSNEGLENDLPEEISIFLDI